MDDSCPDGWAVGHPTLPEVSLHFKCCRLVYTHYERYECPIELWKRYRLKVIRTYRDPTEEVAYAIHARCDPETEKPLELILSFRGLIESFEFVDFNPFSAPSNSALNRRAMLLGTDLNPLPPYCGDCPKARFHSGMLGYFGRLAEDIVAFLRGPEGLSVFADVPLISTGFSMGCGLSALGALLLKKEAVAAGHRRAVKCILFCAPKLGNRAFANFAYQQLDVFDCYYIKDDPVASYPPEPEYVLAANIIVFTPVDADRYLTRAQWSYESYKYTSQPPPGHAVVTDLQMELGIWRESALPLINVFPALRRCHAMVAVRAVLESRPVKKAWLERLRREYEALQPATNSWFEPYGCFVGCPVRPIGEHRAPLEGEVGFVPPADQWQAQPEGVMGVLTPLTPSVRFPSVFAL
eukprot:TRINITY_DN3378_c0_g1_i1.p1 TRINITY_DN3378_c0_g1~~TRINITY_DN3378_c0_g1_i1.p1  ORF type:complete len:432 (+),score=75.00 TRINITY_DN3378_c0_g1_i1:71-1297(+)